MKKKRFGRIENILPTPSILKAVDGRNPAPPGM